MTAMQREIFNGKRENQKSVYGTLRYFVGENRVYPYGDILFVSTRNNEDYDLILIPDGVTNFINLYNKHKDDPMPPMPGGGGELGPDSVGTEELKDGAVSEQKLSADVQEKLNSSVDPETLEQAVNTAVGAAVPTAVTTAVNEAVPVAVANKLDKITDGEFEDIFGQTPSGGSSFENRVASLEQRVAALEGPDSVGTEQIRDGSVQTEDLSDDVKGKIQKTYDQSNESMSMNFDER